jgi:uncharacterized protein YndB with AHSA1/START domain
MYDIAHQLTIGAPQEAVFEAVTTADGLRGWFTNDVEIGPAEGEVQLGFEDGSVRMRFQTDSYDPPVLVHMTCIEGPDEWPNTQLAFRLRPDPDSSGTVLRFWHGNWEYEDGVLPACSFQWAMHLESLRRYLETGTSAPTT